MDHSWQVHTNYTFDCTRMILTFGSFGEGKAFWAAFYVHLIRETSDETW